MTALSVVTACGDDTSVGSATDSETETDSDDSADDDNDDSADDDNDDGPSTVTVDPDSSSSGTATASTGTSESSSDSGSSSETGELCGDGSIDDGELCDGRNVGGFTCEDQGYLGGELACADDCSEYDESGCFAMVCGDGEITGEEECDGDDLGVATCEMQGFDGGVLACDADSCDFDTSGCIVFSCGDGVLNDPREECDISDFGDTETCGDLGLGAGTISCTEQCTIATAACCGSNTVGGAETCDGMDLDGTSCMTLDFDGGVLGCSADCNDFDTSACTTCGDSIIAGTESCDTDELGGFDCTTVPGGFVAGTLACDAGCDFDTSGCNFCGNDIVDGGEDCDGAAPGVGTCITLGHTGGVLACDACSYDDAGCTDFPLPAVGEVVITEIMQNPNATDDTVGEYFELHNPSLVESFQLQGCVVEDADGGESFPIDSDLVIDAGEYLSFARTAMPGFTPDFVWTDTFALNNAADTLRLVCAATAIDEVAYLGVDPWPDPTGASMQLDSAFLTATDNDLGENWCESFSDLGNTDLGTPGAANDSCAPPTFAIDYCNLQFPTTIDELEGTQLDVFGRLYIEGLTDLTAVNDPTANVIGYVGYGPVDSDPTGNASWVWTTAAPNPGWAPVAPPDTNNDEYVANLTAPVAGSYDYAFRFTGDGGLTFTYCDTDGTDDVDPYEIANAGTMTTQEGGDASLLYFSEYVEGSGASNKAVEIWNPGPDAVFLGQCQVRVYNNGAAMPVGTINLNANVASNDAFVLCNNLAGGALNPLCDAGSGSINFNGNDAIDLVCGGATLDVIGQIGFDPMTQWIVNGVGTLDQTLRRDCTVTDGDPVGNDVFDPSLEWDSFPVNTFDGLGTRGCP